MEATTNKSSLGSTTYASVDLFNELAEEEYGQTNASLSATESSDEIQQHSLNIEKTAKKTWIVACLVVLMGAAASASFLYLGISSAKSDKLDIFERRASDTVKRIDSSWGDYEVAAKWIHESCRNWRNNGFNRTDFRILYNYLKSGGLDVSVKDSRLQLRYHSYRSCANT
jgi:hypothetical protein